MLQEKYEQKQKIIEEHVLEIKNVSAENQANFNALLKKKEEVTHKYNKDI